MSLRRIRLAYARIMHLFPNPSSTAQYRSPTGLFEQFSGSIVGDFWSAVFWSFLYPCVSGSFRCVFDSLPGEVQLYGHTVCLNLAVKGSPSFRKDGLGSAFQREGLQSSTRCVRRFVDMTLPQRGQFCLTLIRIWFVRNWNRSVCSVNQNLGSPIS